LGFLLTRQGQSGYLRSRRQVGLPRRLHTGKLGFLAGKSGFLCRLHTGKLGFLCRLHTGKLGFLAGKSGFLCRLHAGKLGFLRLRR
jgi:hypothetical protein